MLKTVHDYRFSGNCATTDMTAHAQTFCSCKVVI